MESLTRIPKERIAVLIGKGGETRKSIEEASGVKLHIVKTAIKRKFNS